MNKEEIFKYKKELAEMIEKKPHLRKYQDEIDRQMKKAGNNPYNRMIYLKQMIVENLENLQNALTDLVNTYEKPNTRK